jgi:DNA adenine methylase
MKEEINIDLKKRNKSLKPFIRWAGGKQNLINEIFSNLDLNNIDRFFEPFLGGASFFLKSDFNQSFLSDLNPNLINCYQQIKNDPDSIFTGLLDFKTPIKEKIYYDIRDKFNKHNGEQTLEQAIRFIFLNRTSFNGIYRVNKSGKYNVPFGKSNPAFSSLEHLRDVSTKLQKANLSFDYYDSIENTTQEGDLIYLDPPYPKLSDTAYFNHYTLDKFDQNSQEELAEFAQNQSRKGCKVVISNADLEDIRVLYNNWEIIECSTYRFISCKKEKIKVKELIIKNF